MKSIKSTTKSKKKFIIPIVIIVIITLGVGLFFSFENGLIDKKQFGLQDSSSEVRENPQAKKSNDQTKKEFIEKTDTINAAPAPVADSSDDITIVAEKRSGTEIVITTELKDFSAGTCKLSITNNGKTVTQAAEVIYQPEFSTCAGFSVPISSLGSGSWSITLLATPSGGDELSKNIVYKVD